MKKPREGSNTCPQCGGKSVDGWCRKCSTRRQLIWGLLTLFLTPILGIGACLSSNSGLYFTGQEPNVILGMLLFYLGPIAGIAIIVMGSTRRGRGS